MSAQAQMQFLGVVDGNKWYWAEPGRFSDPGVYYWDGANNVRVTSVAATLPAAPAPTELPPMIARDMIDTLARFNDLPSPSDDIPQPIAGAIVLLETFARLGMTAERDGKPTPNSLMCLRFASELRALAARQAPAEAPKEPTCWIDPIELRELENGTVAMVTPKQGDAQRIPLFRQAPDSRDAPKEPHDQAKAQQWDDQREAIGRALKGPAQ